MSFDVTLEQNGGIVRVDRHEEGGTYALGGTTVADLNVTYNYSSFYYAHLSEHGLRSLDGRLACDCIPELEKAVKALGTEQDPDYWAKTAGNAGYALNILLGWARQYPNARFRVD